MKICLFSEHFPIFIAQHQRRNECGKGEYSPDAVSLQGAKTHNNAISTFSKQYICFRKTSGSNMGAPNLFLVPGRPHLTSLRPYTSRLSS